jgi:2,4-dienoyl-CoA reductase (NADPH2)
VTTSSRYPRLFSPLHLGPVTLANRLVFAAHLTNYAEDGRPSAQHAAYYAARAEGGAGLIITEEHSTHPTDWPYEKLIHGFHPDVLEGYGRITGAVHQYGTPIFAQINHNGGQASSMYSRRAVWAPSPVADPLFREVPHEVTDSEIAEIVAGYADVAARCVSGGFDGIELQCSHSSIVRGFLSPATNRRSDRWGGNLENRARLLLEVVAAVRDAIGPGHALGVRLCGDELIDGGTRLEDAVAVAQMVEATGHVDYLNTSIGVATATLFMIEASMAVRPGYALFIPSAIRAAVSLPVIGVGRFKDPLQAERALSEGHCDLVGVVRGQIADADFARKAKSGRAEETRLCLSCNQECVGRMGLNRWLGCIENPRTGREAEWSAPRRAARRRRAVIIGGGPAGLQCAATAAARGHEVLLFDSRERFGGMVAVAATASGRAEFGDLTRNLESEARRSGASLHAATSVDVDMVSSWAPDVVVLATGSLPQRPWWESGEGVPVVDVGTLLGSGHAIAGAVLVVDELGFHHATSTAEWLAARGATVTVATPGLVVGQDLGVTLDMESWWTRAKAAGIAQWTSTMVTSNTAEGVGLQNVLTGTTRTEIFDAIVLATPGRGNRELEGALLHRGFDVRVIGDARAPRRAHAAVLDGEREGRSL